MAEALTHMADTPEAAEQLDMMLNRANRDKRGVSPSQQAARGSYAEQRLAELQKEREKYNANHLGYYNGGVPRANRGIVRGDALGSPGTFHSPAIHNYLNNQHADSQRVTQEDAVKFKHYMGTDKADFNRTMPAYPMYYDYDNNTYEYYYNDILPLPLLCYDDFDQYDDDDYYEYQY